MERNRKIDRQAKAEDDGNSLRESENGASRQAIEVLWSPDKHSELPVRQRPGACSSLERKAKIPI
ncbi:hypothetical protein [Rhizobium sp. CECT 9324]|uniref:hypothetical protein n=1 Tax=Rhizobium sp. CECT 9324 TaxID=2845820 RepID=UPI001E292A84|nr:hypothetical protein [Rhizobium sp. CECT 9324]